jgi:NTP pyrophosphatase (non-canonical NTP hydrolase)
MDMNSRATQALADSDIWFPNCRGDIAHHLISLAGEVGELCNVYKKWDRSDEVSIPDVTLMKMKDEIVDVLVYLYNLAGELNMDVEAQYDDKRLRNHYRFAPVGVPLAGTGADVGATRAHPSG